jgi:hypothetical protein
MLISLRDTQEESQTYGVIRFSSKSKNILYSRYLAKFLKLPFLKYSRQKVQQKHAPNEQSKLYTSHGRTSAKDFITYHKEPY